MRATNSKLASQSFLEQTAKPIVVDLLNGVGGRPVDGGASAAVSAVPRPVREFNILRNASAPVDVHECLEVEWVDGLES